jgi:ribose transport system permease protein
VTAVAERRRVAPPTRAAALAWVREYGIYPALALAVAVNAAVTPNFLTVTGLRVQLIQVAPVVLVALGLALVIGTGGIDISVGSIMALAAAVVPLYLGYGMVVAVVAALVVGLLAGLLNGALVAVVGVQPIVATLALLVGGRGVALVMADGQLKQIRNEAFLFLGGGSVLGVPMPVVVATAAVVVTAVVVRRTTFGRRVVAVGGNASAARLAGLPVRRTLFAVYLASGLLAALAGVVTTARLTASDPRAVGELVELEAIAAVVVGGTALTGGRVRIVATVAGALLIQLIRAALIANDVPNSVARMVQALFIVAAVLLQRRGGAS